MAEVEVILRPRLPHPAELAAPLPARRPACRPCGDNLPQLDAVSLNAIEYCPGCRVKMTVARLEAWIVNEYGCRVRRLGPVHPNCRDTVRFDHPGRVVFIHPALTRE